MQQMSCANCGVRGCTKEEGQYPEFCLTANTPSEVFEYALEQYNADELTSRLFQAAARVECVGYGKLTRAEEIALFAREIGAKKIGIACCMAVADEARTFAKSLQAKGFDSVLAVLCKVGSCDKTAAGIPEELKLKPGTRETMCNPVAQARIMNEAGTDLNVVMGLCVGHDSIFIMNSEAPVTYLMVKDRVLGHNPAAALYAGNYKKRLMQPGFPGVE